MKIFKKSYLGTLLIATCIISCKKSQKDGLPAPVNTIVSSSTLAKLKQYGTVINEGTTPPDITGVYLIQPNVCPVDNSAEQLKGETFDDYLYKFSKQDNKSFTIRLDFTSNDDSVVDSGSDSTATFISGKNNLFTVFAQSTGVSYGVNYTTLEVVSGEISSSGIKNLQITKYLQSKGDDPTPFLTEVGTTRIFYDSDYLSDRQTGTTALGLIKQASQLKSVNHPAYLARPVRH
ncbi:MAG: hypothetical protein JSU01_01095 [Bacteroidetes bacterium]|nr:hypothetical protein [Bacteroidota bacterium]